MKTKITGIILGLSMAVIPLATSAHTACQAGDLFNTNTGAPCVIVVGTSTNVGENTALSFPIVNDFVSNQIIATSTESWGCIMAKDEVSRPLYPFYSIFYADAACSPNFGD